MGFKTSLKLVKMIISENFEVFVVAFGWHDILYDIVRK